MPVELELEGPFLSTTSSVVARRPLPPRPSPQLERSRTEEDEDAHKDPHLQVQVQAPSHAVLIQVAPRVIAPRPRIPGPFRCKVRFTLFVCLLC